MNGSWLDLDPEVQADDYCFLGQKRFLIWRLLFLSQAANRLFDGH